MNFTFFKHGTAEQSIKSLSEENPKNYYEAPCYWATIWKVLYIKGSPVIELFLLQANVVKQ